jgi:hypothetical protein
MLKNMLQTLAIAGVCFAFTGQPLPAQEYRLPVRVIARADIHQLRYNEYSVHECLDVYNDDNRLPLIITAITADSWRGHQKHNIGENWFEDRPPLTVPPNSTIRVTERKRVVSGRYCRNCVVRWIRFTVSSNRGEFVSNFVASPFKRPGVLESEIPQKHIDTLGEPQAITPGQKELLQKP